MPSRISIYVVEDDAEMRATLVRFIESVGMTVDSFDNVRDLEKALAVSWPDVIVLDINLPDESGFVAAARLRARSEIGIIMLTGRVAHDDRLLGLSIGADHYLSKPIDMRELESVIRNLARRLPNDSARSPSATNEAMPAGSPLPSQASPPGDAAAWILNREGWTLTSPSGVTVDLSAAEYQCLVPLLENPGQPGSRELLNARLGRPRVDPGNRSVDVLMSRTRKKIETATGEVLPLRSARGSGYVFTGIAVVKGSAVGD